MKKPDGGETADVEDVTGCPPKAVIAREVNITMAKAVSLFIFAFLHVIHAANVALTGQIVVLRRIRVRDDLIHVFDRVTGKPVWPIEERPG